FLLVLSGELIRSTVGAGTHSVALWLLGALSLVLLMRWLNWFRWSVSNTSARRGAAAANRELLRGALPLCGAVAGALVVTAFVKWDAPFLEIASTLADLLAVAVFGA